MEAEFEKHKQFYLKHFGEETNIEEGRGTYSDYIDEIVKAIETNTPIPRFPDDADT